LDAFNYFKEEDDFMIKFKWDLASQGEKERFIKLADKYMIHNNNNNILQSNIMKIEPLCLEVSNSNAYLYGWFNIQKEIMIPEKVKIWSALPRILQCIYYNDSSNYVRQGYLILHHNKLYIKSVSQGFHSEFTYNSSYLNNTDNKVPITTKKYAIIFIRFSINI
jgi:hypothetical protein